MPAKKKKPIDTKRLLVRGLIALSVVLNVAFIIGSLAAVSYLKSERSTFDMLNFLIGSKLDDKGCIVENAKQDPDQSNYMLRYGAGAKSCVRITVESPDGTIQWPETLKGQKYLK